MPRSLDPNSRLTMVLACDADKPAASQPRIYAKAPTLGTQRKLISLLSSLNEGENITQKFDAILDAAMLCLTGWDNIPVEFSREGIESVLSLEELVEVFGFLVSQSEPTVDDKKKSELPHLSGAENSADLVVDVAGEL